MGDIDKSNQSIKNNVYKILFFISLVLLISGAIVSFLLVKQKTNNTSDTAQISETVSVESEQPGESSNQEDTSIQKSHYGEFQLQIPAGWKNGNCGGVACPINIMPSNTEDYIDNMIVFEYTTDQKYASSDIYFRLNQEKPDSPLIDFSKNLNFCIPNIDNSNNATFKESSNSSVIYFKYRGIIYYFYTNYSKGSEYGLSPNDLNQTLKKYASSIIFLNEPSTCKEPALLPLNDFPGSFSLYNYHESDNSDPINSYWPWTETQTSEYYQQLFKKEAAENSHRGFMVNYVKDGDSFVGGSDLLTKMISILPNSDFSSNGYGEKTEIWHINCIDTQEDGGCHRLPYYLSDGTTDDFFSLNMYVDDSTKAQLLWNTDKWNIELLRATRSKVYVRRGSIWQAYKAIGYFATIPTSYGGKPAIYLYSPKIQSVNIEIHPQGQLIEADERYNSSINGWQVTAGPKGITDTSEGYLYYEAMIPVKQPITGYVIPYSQLFTFSKEYVKELGLNEEESNEFISFWKEKLPKSPYYFVSHLNQETISKIYPLSINPTPDTLIRVEIYFKPLLEKISVSPPIKPIPPKRNGFVAVEWGGILDQN